MQPLAPLPCANFSASVEWLKEANIDLRLTAPGGCVLDKSAAPCNPLVGYFGADCNGTTSALCRSKAAYIVAPANGTYNLSASIETPSSAASPSNLHDAYTLSVWPSGYDERILGSMESKAALVQLTMAGCAPPPPPSPSPKPSPSPSPSPSPQASPSPSPEQASPSPSPSPNQPSPSPSPVP